MGRREIVTSALKSLKRSGRVVVVGTGKERIETPPLYIFVNGEFSIMGSLGFDNSDLNEVLQLVDSGKLDLSTSVSETMPLGNINAALEKIANREGDSLRIVVIPQE